MGSFRKLYTLPIVNCTHNNRLTEFGVQFDLLEIKLSNNVKGLDMEKKSNYVFLQNCTCD